MLIDALRGRPATIERLAGLRRRGHVPCTTAINVEEIYRGLLEREDDAAVTLFDGLRIAPIGRPEGARAGRWRRRFATSGVTLSQADCLIAAAAVSLGVPLATGNPGHFPMTELDLHHWPTGE